jgi:hypothetical protein
MYKIVLCLVFVAILIGASTCFAGICKIFPIKMGEQNELLIQGQTLLVSGKHNPVVMCHTEDIMKNGQGTFYFACANNENFPINLYFQNLSVTDQWGRPIKVIKKEELIAKKRTKTRWKKFASALCTGLEACNAQSAGDINYRSSTNNVYHINGKSNGSNGRVNSSGNIIGSSSTEGIIHCEALSRQAMRQVRIDSQARMALIEGECQDYEFIIKNSYFDSNTLFPNALYESFFEIDVPRQVEKQLEYIYVTVDFGKERHSFCFYCAKPKR